MNRALSLPVGVVIACDKIDHPWQEYLWRPVGVFLNAPPVDAWRELRRGPAFVHYHAATLALELHPKETPGYVANLTEDEPVVYVVLRERADNADAPVEIALVSVSGYEVQAYGYSSEETVGSVPMPEPLLELLEAFVAEHHVDEPFVKRQRIKHHRAEEHNFGQEPIDVLRERMRQAGGKGGRNE